MFKGFREFIMRGNVVEMAVGIVIGIAFGAVINSFVKNLITPIIGIIGGKDFSAYTFTINGSTFTYGNFINDLIAFILIAAAVYYVVVVPMNRMAEHRKAGASPDKKDCPECLAEIPYAASKCMYCGSHQLTVVEQKTPARS
jgi:large conductance mechanosensitive channel